MLVRDLRIGLLQYFIGTTKVFCTLIDQQGNINAFGLGDCGEIFPKVDNFFQSINRHKFDQEFSKGWGKRLLPPFKFLTNFDVIVIIPHHFLHGVPFHCIWLEEANEFLGTFLGITYCSSSTLFIRSVDRNLIRKQDVFNWKFSINEGETYAPTFPKRCLGVGVDVLESKNDLYSSVAKNFAEKFEEPVVASTACRAIIKNRMKGKDRWEVLCIVCHGYQDEIADDSGLLLEKDTLGFIIRPIFLHRGEYYDFRDLPFRYPPLEIEEKIDSEIMTIGELKVDCVTDAQLVALFGCSTASGQLSAGDNFNSMAYQWLKIGAASILGNMWEVNVDFLNKWSDIFLKNWLLKRQPKAVACQQTLKEILAQKNDLNPSLWGPVALFGDWL